MTNTLYSCQRQLSHALVNDWLDPSLWTSDFYYFSQALQEAMLIQQLKEMNEVLFKQQAKPETATESPQPVQLPNQQVGLSQLNDDNRWL